MKTDDIHPEKGVLTGAAQDYKTKCVLCFTKGIVVGKKVVRGTLSLLEILRTCPSLSSTVLMSKGHNSVGNTTIGS